MKGSPPVPHPAVSTLDTHILRDEHAMTPHDREARYQRIVASGEPHQHERGRPSTPISVRSLAMHARKTLTPNEERFWRESHRRWPTARFLRYHDVSLETTDTIGAMLCRHPSVWYAPFCHAQTKTILVLDDHPDFPYRISGQNRDLYARDGYTILDFAEDFSCATDDAVWDEAMAMVHQAITRVFRVTSS